MLCFVDNCLSYCLFSFVCSSMYGFWLPLWYLQVFQNEFMFNVHNMIWQCAMHRIFSLCCAFLICLSILCKKKNDGIWICVNYSETLSTNSRWMLFQKPTVCPELNIYCYEQAICNKLYSTMKHIGSPLHNMNFVHL